MQNARRIAIIGAGPRGLSALESLITNLAGKIRKDTIQVFLFEKTQLNGCSPVYAVHQTAANWANISERVLILEKRPAISILNKTLPTFPSYHEWANLEMDVLVNLSSDVYPTRRKIGQYLKERFDSIVYFLQKLALIECINARVDNISNQGKELALTTKEGKSHIVDEVLLTIGHQSTKMDEQIEKWQKYATENNKVSLFADPYPIKKYLEHDKINKKSRIGLRGFGLAMIDVIRGILEELGGQFVRTDEFTKAVKFELSTKTPRLFVPFSLDGLPMSPKPLNATIDKWFEPSKAQIQVFKKRIGDKIVQSKASTPYFLIEAIAPIIANLYTNLDKSITHQLTIEVLSELTIAWLKSENFKHPLFLSNEKPAKFLMENYVDMAVGRSAISLDYFIGQVWRHCQSTIYEALSHSNCSDEVIAAIIGLDERMKRYAYGPPVESLQQLLALISANVLTLDFVNDPTLKTTEKGWLLSSNNRVVTVNVMIDTVLDAPKLKAVNTPIILNLLKNDLIQPIHDDLGIHTDENGYVISKTTNENISIAYLGRLAKGTVIGVDAILECFGTRPEKWAVQAVKNYSSQLPEKPLKE